MEEHKVINLAKFVLLSSYNFRIRFMLEYMHHEKYE